MPLRLLLLALLLLAPGLGLAQADLCDRAATGAAAQTGVPVEVMLALTRAETGRNRQGQLQPWPWAVNQAGQGHWFDTAAAAQDFVQAQLSLGYSNLDIGCFQLNHRWHGMRFPDLATMFDPEANALYAARFIAGKYRETGDWVRAAGAYHSGTDSFAERYAGRFAEILDGVQPAPLHLAALDLPGAAPPRVNAYPLLQAGAAGGAGSLVPRRSGMGSLFARLP